MVASLVEHFDLTGSFKIVFFKRDYLKMKYCQLPVISKAHIASCQSSAKHFAVKKEFHPVMLTLRSCEM